MWVIEKEFIRVNGDRDRGYRIIESGLVSVTNGPILGSCRRSAKGT